MEVEIFIGDYIKVLLNMHNKSAPFSSIYIEVMFKFSHWTKVKNVKGNLQRS